MRLFLFLVMSLMLVSCGGVEIANKLVCKPIYISKDDVLTKGTKQQIVTNNESWKQQTLRN